MHLVSAPRRVPLLTIVLLAAAFGSEARAGLIINPTFNDATIPNGVTATEFHSAVNYAIQEFESHFSDNIHINITFQFGNTGLGESSTHLTGYFTYAQIRQALINDNAAHPSAAGNTSVANLPTSDPTGTDRFLTSTAEAKALGLIADNLANDGTVTFSNAQPYTFDPNHRGTGGFDFIGVAEHEISEVMGRIPLLGQNLGNGPTYDPNDLFRFTANGRSLSASATGVYFSIDGGATNLVNFNSGGGDKDDYKGDNPTDPFNASTGPNQAHALNSVDFTNLDVIGYDLITGQSAVPEPATITLLGIGLACGMVVRRCRRPRATPQ